MDKRTATFSLVVCAGLVAGATAMAQTTYYEGEDREHYVGNAGSFYPQFDIGSTAPPEVTAAIESLVTDFAGRWRAKTWPTVKDLFSPDDEPYVLLAHQPDWLVGWDELNGYFSRKPTMPVKSVPGEAPPGLREIEASHYESRAENDLAEMMYTPDRIRVRMIDDGLALAIWYVDFQFKPRFGSAKGEHFKANAVFRNTADGWKFIHYGEAPMSAIMYMERLYRSQVSQEFLDLLSTGQRQR
ncbi:MAG: hypothetical protein F4Y72_04640 [Gammaproteobacteria bacterium]|nr:hypothetical protein [Gammaproteobacteria bacterium]